MCDVPWWPQGPLAATCGRDYINVWAVATGGLVCTIDARDVFEERYEGCYTRIVGVTPRWVVASGAYALAVWALPGGQLLARRPVYDAVAPRGLSADRAWELVADQSLEGGRFVEWALPGLQQLACGPPLRSRRLGPVRPTLETTASRRTWLLQHLSGVAEVAAGSALMEPRWQPERWFSETPLGIWSRGASTFATLTLHTTVCYRGAGKPPDPPERVFLRAHAGRDARTLQGFPHAGNLADPLIAVNDRFLALLNAEGLHLFDFLVPPS